LEEPFEWIETSTLKKQTRTGEFLKLNPNGKIPLLQLDDGRLLPESNAILCYLAEGTVYLPADRWLRAEVLQWLFWEQYSHEPYIATARFIQHFLKHPDEPSLPQKRERGYQALAVMEQHLSTRSFFVCETYTVADISLYAYTHVAAQGGFDLTRFPAVQSWLARVAQQPRHLPLRW
ncbi:MAG TPA: glutathione S-transferase family protein, partial [Gammaproteobacteria bacterium]